MAGIQFRQPKDFAERFGVAEQCSARLDLKSPVLIDNIANTTCDDYAAFPDRLYIIDMDGKVSYKGGRGPFGYKPKEMEQTLLLMMMEAQIKSRKKTVSTEKKKQPSKVNPPVTKPSGTKPAEPKPEPKPPASTKTEPSGSKSESAAVKKPAAKKPTEKKPTEKKSADKPQPKKPAVNKAKPKSEKKAPQPKNNGKLQINKIVSDR